MYKCGVMYRDFRGSGSHWPSGCAGSSWAMGMVGHLNLVEIYFQKCTYLAAG